MRLHFHKFLGMFAGIGLSINLANANPCIEVGVIHNAPIGFVDNSGHWAGVHWDYLTAIAERAGLCFDKRLLPYARLWKSLEHGHHDSSIAFRSSDRDRFVVPAAFVRRIRNVVIPRKDLEVSNLKELEGLLVGKTRGTRLSDNFDNDENIHKVELTNYQQVIGMLKSGRIDAIAGSGMALSYHLKQNNALDAVNLSSIYVLGEREQWFQFSQQSENLKYIPQISDAIESLREEGVLDDILTRYHGPQWMYINGEISAIKLKETSPWLMESQVR